MNEIIILFLIFSTLFIIEKKSINLLAYYIGMVIIIAIVISNYEEINNNILNTIHIPTPQMCEQKNIYNIGYISYILILVQISALTILFGFIIMLFPNNNTDILIKNQNIFTTKNNIIIKNINTIFNIQKLLLGIFVCGYIYYISIPFLYTQNYPEGLLKLINENIYNIILEIFSQYHFQWDIYNTDLQLEQVFTKNFLKKLSGLMYSELSNICKFIIIMLILLFAIIGLFFILLPTYI